MTTFPTSDRLTETQARTMVTLQAGMNARVNPDWVHAGYPYLRAALVEGAEAIEHHGWKWWKKQDKDLAQLRMELVDIWHFGLSHLLIRVDGDQDKATHRLLEECQADTVITFDGKHYDVAELDLLQKLELSIGLAAAERFSVPLFAAQLHDCEMDWNELFCQYVGKNVLNFFRQDNGYKEGNYSKHWDGREDNEHLVEAIEELDSTAEDFRHQLYSSLEARYKRRS